jgi:hypothetical protein
MTNLREIRPSEQDREMLDWLSERLYLKPAQVLRQALKRLFDIRIFFDMPRPGKQPCLNITNFNGRLRTPEARVSYLQHRR